MPSAPLIAVLIWLVRRYDGGPAVIGVDRVGRDGRQFRMWKLRSMRAADSMGRAGGSGLTSASDDRITPVGRVLRTLHLDELPQLVNVLRGEMTLLGPRPEAPEYVDLDDEQWRAVLRMPPGILGPTQLAVGDWERDVITAAPDGSAYLREVVPVKLAIDRWYIDRATPMLDARVVVAFAQRLCGCAPRVVLRRIISEIPSARAVLTEDLNGEFPHHNGPR